MIVVHYAVRPLANSRHVGYISEIAKQVPTVFVEPQTESVFRVSRRDHWSRPIPELSAPLPRPGLHLVRMGSVIPFGRFARIAERNRVHGLNRIIRKLRRTCPGEKIVVTVLRPDFVSQLKKIDADLRVYEVRDDYAASAATEKAASRTRQQHETALDQADVVVAISERLVADIKPRRPDCVLTTVGVEYSLFSTASSAEAPERLRQIPSPRVGLVGNFNDRIDWNLLELCAERLPYVSIVLIGSLYHAGPGTRASFDKLIGHANVHAIGRLPHEQLPSAIAALDVGIIPYGMSPAVERINSLKFMQYLAAGKPVVTTPIPFLADRHVLARIESDPVRFVNAVREACLEAGDPTGADLRQRYARRHDWSEIAREQLEIYGAGLARSA